MDPALLTVNAKALLLRISIVTGWTNPEGQLLAILVDQFTKKLTEGYQHVNADEMEYAFRNYGTTVKDWGKAVNLSLIDEVMIPFLGARKEASKIEEQKAPVELQPATEDLGDAAMIDWAIEMRQRILSGAVNIRFMPPMLYDNLEKMGKLFLSKQMKKEFVVKAINYRQAELVADVESDNSIGNRTKINNFMTMKETRVFVGQEAENLRVLAKKIALYEFLKDAWE